MPPTLLHLMRKLFQVGLRLDWWESKSISASVSRGFEVKVSASDVITTIPKSFARLHESSIETWLSRVKCGIAA